MLMYFSHLGSLCGTDCIALQAHGLYVLYPGLSQAGVRGGGALAPLPHFLTDQFTLSQPGETYIMYAHHITTYVPLRIFRPCDGPGM